MSRLTTLPTAPRVSGQRLPQWAHRGGDDRAGEGRGGHGGGGPPSSSVARPDAACAARYSHAVTRLGARARLRRVTARPRRAGAAASVAQRRRWRGGCKYDATDQRLPPFRGARSRRGSARGADSHRRRYTHRSAHPRTGARGGPAAAAAAAAAPICRPLAPLVPSSALGSRACRSSERLISVAPWPAHSPNGSRTAGRQRLDDSGVRDG